jgi:hypothetical protein
MSPSHLSFALNAPGYKDFAKRPLVGWIAGIDLADLGKVKPKVFDGSTGRALDDAAVVMHVQLPAGKVPEVKIINIFTPVRVPDAVEVKGLDEGEFGEQAYVL